MLTYAVPENTAEAVVLRNFKRYPTVAEADRECVGTDVLVYNNDELILIYPINALWSDWYVRARKNRRWQLTRAILPKWGRRVELYIRLRLKLRARRTRLSAKAR